MDSTSKAAADAKILVRRMVDAGEWPTPALLVQIVAAGDAAVPYLLELLHAEPDDLEESDTVRIAMGLLSVIRPREAIAELKRVVARLPDEIASDAAEVLGASGDAGFEALIELCTDPSINGYRRAFVFDSAAYAALDGEGRRTRLAPILRRILDESIDKAREELKRVGFLKKHPVDDEIMGDKDFDDPDEYAEELLEGNDESEGDDESILDGEFDEEAPIDSDQGAHDEVISNGLDEDFDDDFDDEDDEIKTQIAEEVGFAAGALGIIGDGASRFKIKTAFRDGLIDESILSENAFEERFAEAPSLAVDEENTLNWLDFYRLDYDEYLEETGQKPPAASSTRGKYNYQDRYDEGQPPEDIPATLPIRNAQEKVGRNDPCWCGSGKKFKKCHLGKEGPGT